MADRAPSGGTKVPEAPAPLLVEQQMNSPDGPFVRRVAPDGSYREYSASLTAFEGGMMKTTPVDPDWRRKGQAITSGSGWRSWPPGSVVTEREGCSRALPTSTSGVGRSSTCRLGL